MKKKLLSVLMIFTIITSLVVTSTATDVSAKSKKKKKKAETTVVTKEETSSEKSEKKTEKNLPEEVTRFSCDTWKPTYSYWTEDEIKSAEDRGTGKNLFDKYPKIWDSDLFNDEEFRKICAAMSQATYDGNYGCIEDSDDKLLESYFQNKIKTVNDVWTYLCWSGYTYGADDHGSMGCSNYGWTHFANAQQMLFNSRGVCKDTAILVCWLLEGDYEETGVVEVTSDHAHMYNYIKDNGTYYFIDFTDFTNDFEGKYILYGKRYTMSPEDWMKYFNWDYWYDDRFNSWVNSICFWSGDSLNSPSATKAALIHDTYEETNCRHLLSMDFNYDHTQTINAIRYYDGTDTAVSTFIEAGQLFADWYNLKLDYMGFSIPEYTWYQTLWVNETERCHGDAWKELPPIELKLVPWYMNLSSIAKEKETETYWEKMSRQIAGYLTDYHDKMNVNNHEIRLSIYRIMDKCCGDYILNDYKSYGEWCGYKNVRKRVESDDINKRYY